MKIRTVGELQDVLDHELSWRLKEIADLKFSVRSSLALRQQTLIRAGVPLLYAHWEGFVKKSAEDYVVFVAAQRLRYDELASNFIAFAAKRRIEDLTGSRKARMHIAAVDFFLTGLSDRANLAAASFVDTRSNLNSDVFEDIALSIGIDSRRYEARYNLIDASLLKRRNQIAHGEYVDLDESSYSKLADEVIELMRCVKTDIENAAVTGLYRRSV